MAKKKNWTEKEDALIEHLVFDKLNHDARVLFVAKKLGRKPSSVAGRIAFYTRGIRSESNYPEDE